MCLAACFEESSVYLVSRISINFGSRQSRVPERRRRTLLCVCVRRPCTLASSHDGVRETCVFIGNGSDQRLLYMYTPRKVEVAATEL